MKKKYIIGIVVGLVFIAIAVMSFDKSKVEYSNFVKAKSSGKVYQVIGSWVQDKPNEYNTTKNEFSFYMKDDANNISKVVFTGSKPNNFDIAPSVVVKGQFEGDVFKAHNLLTKCPSKYDGKDMEEHDKAKKASM
jgi:cytochrome c-type biogenesis protein CcmE